MPLIYLSCAWVAGILLGSKLDLHPALALVSLAPLAFALCVRKYRRPAVLLSLCLAAILGGAVRFHSTQTAGLQSFNGSMVEAHGTVDADPDVRDRLTHIYLRVTAMKSEGEWQKADGTVLLFAARYPAWAYGDELLVSGRLETPQSEGFDYRSYLAHRGVHSVMRYPRIEVLGKGHGSKLMAAIYLVRNRLSDVLAQLLPEPQASLAQGIVLGKRGNIPSWLNRDFSRTGTTHLLAISGVNISIVTGILLSVGLWLWGKRRYLYVWVALVTVWLYAILTGMNPPVFRAAIMASLFLFAELLGRQRQALHALCLAAAVMVGISPGALWDASFQLSFLAMMGLVMIVPWLQARGRQLAPGDDNRVAASLSGILTGSFAVTTGAIIFVWPVIAHYFGIVSLVGPVATLLAAPALAPITVTGMLAGGVGIVALPVAHVLGWLAWLWLSYFLAVVNVLAAVPSAALTVTPSPVLLWVYYPALVLVLWSASRRRIVALALPRLVRAGTHIISIISGLPRKWVIPPLLAMAVLTSFIAATMPDGNLHVSFLDVGQGDAILLQTPGRQNILIDGGPSPQALGAALGQKLPFWSRTVDLVVVTHPHADHLNGLVDVLGRYRVGQLLYPDLPGSAPSYTEFHRLTREKGIPSTLARAGQQVSLGEGVTIEVLSPAEARAIPDVDNASLVLRLSMGKVSFLLASDIKMETELDLVTGRSRLASTVLKVAHHGSDTSSSTGFLAVVSPQVAVVSVGRDNRFGHPAREVVDRLRQVAENVYRTDEHGTVELITDGERLWVKTQK